MNMPAAGPASVASVEDLELLARLRRGNEAAFAALVQRLYGPMLRLAMVQVGNQAKTRAVRERRTVPFSSFGGPEEPGGPAVEPERFLAAGERWAGHRARSKVRRALEEYLDGTGVAG
jgi:hypothetical protein